MKVVVAAKNSKRANLPTNLNLLDLRKRFLLGTEAIRAGKILQKVREGRNKHDLTLLLRHHKQKRVHKGKEIKLRDSFDMLLAFYSLVEIGNMIGYVELPLPQDYAVVARFDLSQESVLRYYQVHYPLVLPMVARRRLEMAQTLEERDDAGMGYRAFVRFLSLEERFRRNEDLGLILKLIDSFTLDGYDISDVVEIVAEPSRFLKKINKTKDNRNTLEQALQGFLRLLDFCRELDELLSSISVLPLLRSSMWHYHAYWFRLIRKKFADNLNAAVGSFAKWALPKSSVAAKSEIDAYVLSTQRIVNRLTSDRYGAYLTKLLTESATPVSVFSSF
jgi:hypothetical protein